MRLRPILSTFLCAAGLITAVGACSSNGAVLRDRTGWPVPTHALASLDCYRQDGDALLWWDRHARQPRAGIWTCGPYQSFRGERFRGDHDVSVSAPPAAPTAPEEPSPVRPPSVSAPEQPTTDLVR